MAEVADVLVVDMEEEEVVLRWRIDQEENLKRVKTPRMRRKCLSHSVLMNNPLTDAHNAELEAMTVQIQA